MTVSMKVAQAQLPELIAQLPPDGELVISDNDGPVAKLVRVEKKSWPCQAGSAKDIPHWMAYDINAPLE